jgi:hypothetical protein
VQRLERPEPEGLGAQLAECAACLGCSQEGIEVRNVRLGLDVELPQALAHHRGGRVGSVLFVEAERLPEDIDEGTVWRHHRR